MSSFIRLEDLPQRELIPGYKVRFLHSEKMTVAYYDIAAGAPFPEHQHPHEQISHVIEGEFELTIEGETRRLKPGIVANIPANARHVGRAISACRIIDVFYPVREDYK